MPVPEVVEKSELKSIFSESPPVVELAKGGLEVGAVVPRDRAVQAFN